MLQSTKGPNSQHRSGTAPSSPPAGIAPAVGTAPPANPPAEPLCRIFLSNASRRWQMLLVWIRAPPAEAATAVKTQAGRQETVSTRHAGNWCQCT